MADKKPRLKPSSVKTDVSDDERYDVLIVPANAGFRPAVKAIRSIVMTLNFRGFASPVDEAVHTDWAEIYCEPGPASHEVFHKGPWTGPRPIFLECMVRAGTEEAEFDYGPDRPVYFAIEFRGCLFKEPLGPFRKLLKDSLNFRSRVYYRDHESLPPHRTVGDEDGPEDPASKRRERGPGIAGSDIEEW